MGTTKQGDAEVRKIQQTGEKSQTYYVTLPVKAIRDLGWQVHQKVTVRRDGDTLVIKDWEEN